MAARALCAAAGAIHLALTLRRAPRFRMWARAGTLFRISGRACFFRRSLSLFPLARRADFSGEAFAPMSCKNLRGTRVAMV
eukprot:3075654-Alexandrium_andersonii.AAC.1